MKVFSRIEQRAQSNPRHVVLVEGEDPRIIQGAHRAASTGAAQITLLGDADKIQAAAKTLNLDLAALHIIDPQTASAAGRYAVALHELRRHKGITEEQARKMMQQPLYFGAMMVRLDDADGCVGGATLVTADVVRAAIQVIGVRKQAKLISSFFLMLLCEPHHSRQGGLIFADCGLNVAPDAEQLAEIAIASADSGRNLLNAEPKVAMLSFSTWHSARHPRVKKIIQATAIARKLRPDLLIEGDIQFDAAFVPAIAAAKAPGSKTGGNANVLIFPDLDAGNIGYKIAQRIGLAGAIGPILQGLDKPMNDLSRGCNADDVYRVINITVLQAQAAQ